MPCHHPIKQVLHQCGIRARLINTQQPFGAHLSHFHGVRTKQRNVQHVGAATHSLLEFKPSEACAQQSTFHFTPYSYKRRNSVLTRQHLLSSLLFFFSRWFIIFLNVFRFRCFFISPVFFLRSHTPYASKHGIVALVAHCSWFLFLRSSWKQRPHNIPYVPATFVLCVIVTTVVIVKSTNPYRHLKHSRVYHDRECDFSLCQQIHSV